ncbi:hypothetical protein PIIN_08338 [Serendipita indica DSM 11827]|uniref:Uncharacterized protein n=1 Tax=Serendipita indica (strain DSM 11827) TaxID=1109443 RepID=G4TST9_SERID|nr:hypothetical protein PIIN_08338 [Serendipita indica DSM 11827]
MVQEASRSRLAPRRRLWRGSTTWTISSIRNTPLYSIPERPCSCCWAGCTAQILYGRASWSFHKTVQATGQTVNDTCEWNLYRDFKAVPDDRQANATLHQQYDLTQETFHKAVYRVDNATQPPIATLGMPT